MRPPHPPQNPRPWLAHLLSLALLVLLLWLVGQRLHWALLQSLDFSVVWHFRWALLEGLGVSLQVTVIALGAGFVLTLPLVVALQSPRRWLNWGCRATIELIRDIPFVVLLLWGHFALPLATGIPTTPLQSGSTMLALKVATYSALVVHAGILALPRGQLEAADALGLPLRVKWGIVLLPQALRIVVPTLASLAIMWFQFSAVLSIISVPELMTRAERIVMAVPRPIEVLSSVALLYLLLGLTFTYAVHRLERRWTPPSATARS